MSISHDDIALALRTAYDAEADDREERGRAKTPWKLAERSAFLDRVVARQGRRLLEIGAGTGQDSHFFTEHGLEVVAIDLSPRMVELCRAKGVDAHVGDALELDLPQSSFDAVYALNVFLHISNGMIGKALERVRSVMRSGALFFLGVYGGRSYEGSLEHDDHVPPRFFSFRLDDELRALVGPFFEIFDFHTVQLEPAISFQAMALRRGELDRKRPSRSK